MLYDQKTLFRFIDDHVDQMTEDILDLIRVPSVSRDVAKTAEALHLMLDKASRMGFDTSSLLGDRIGLVEMGGEDEVIGVLAHLDVVEVGEDWTIPPFAGLVKDGMIWGRGAVDDKGPLVAALYAMYAVKSMPQSLTKKVQLILGTQEEVAWTDIDDYVQQYRLPDYGFTPDGEFPVTNIEKGYCDISLDFKKEAAGGGEFEILSLEAGEIPNSVPSRARALIKGDCAKLESMLKDYLQHDPEEKLTFALCHGDGLITAFGVTVHSSVPEKGINAISVLCRFLNRLDLQNNGAASLVSFIASCFDYDVYGQGIGLYSQSEYLNGEYIHRNVLVPTLIKTQEERFRIVFNIRNAIGTRREDIEKSFQALAVQYAYTIADMDYFEPIYISKDKPFIKIMGEAYAEISGLDGKQAIGLGTTYAKAMPNIVSWGPVFPGEEEFCHAADERVSIESLVKATKIYAKALAEMVFSPATFK